MLISVLGHPRVLKHLRDCQTAVNITVQHRAEQINACFREWQTGYAQRMVENLIHVVEGILLVDDRI